MGIYSNFNTINGRIFLGANELYLRSIRLQPFSNQVHFYRVYTIFGKHFIIFRWYFWISKTNDRQFGLRASTHNVIDLIQLGNCYVRELIWIFPEIYDQVFEELTDGTTYKTIDFNLLTPTATNENEILEEAREQVLYNNFKAIIVIPKDFTSIIMANQTSTIILLDYKIAMNNHDQLFAITQYYILNP